MSTAVAKYQTAWYAAAETRLAANAYSPRHWNRNLRKRKNQRPQLRRK